MKHLWVFDQNKLKILDSIYRCSDGPCGCDLVNKLEIPKNLLSHHIKSLKEHQFILETKLGRKCHYQINPEYKNQIKKILSAVEII